MRKINKTLPWLDFKVKYIMRTYVFNIIKEEFFWQIDRVELEILVL